MLKFKYAKRKGDVTEISYEEFIRAYRCNEPIYLWKCYEPTQKIVRERVNPLDILFSDEWEIVYYKDFTISELIAIKMALSKDITKDRLINKIDNIIDKYIKNGEME